MEHMETYELSVALHAQGISRQLGPIRRKSGRIRTKGSVRPASPSGMVSVDSGSIYLEYHSCASEVGGSKFRVSPFGSLVGRSRSDDKLLPDPEQSPLPPSTSEDSLSGSGVEAGAAETVRSDCPADEGQGVLRPGSASRSRHNEKEAPQTSLPSKPIVLVPSTKVLLSAPPRVPGLESFEATIVAQNVS